MLLAEVPASITYIEVNFLSANGLFLPVGVSKRREYVFVSLKGGMKQGPQWVSGELQ